MPKKRKPSWTKADVVENSKPKSPKETSEAYDLRLSMDMAVRESVQWLSRQGLLPLDFNEIRSKHWKGLTPVQLEKVLQLEKVFDSTVRAREYLAQRNVEGAALQMFKVGLFLGLARVGYDAWLAWERGRAAATYKGNKAKHHALILKAYDAQDPRLKESEKYDLVRKDKNVELQKLDPSDATIRRLKRERASKP